MRNAECGTRMRKSEPRAVATGPPDLGLRNADFVFELSVTVNPQSDIPNPQSDRPVATALDSDSGAAFRVRLNHLSSSVRSPR